MTSYILQPASIPPFHADDFAFQDEDVYATVKFGRGPRRKRRLWTGKPRAVTFRWVLTQAQRNDLFDFFEETLKGGERTWNAILRTEEGLRYWEVAFVEQPEDDPEPTPRGPMWTVTGTLLAIGDPMDEAPDLLELAAELGLALETTATVLGSATLAAELGLALETVETLEAELGLPLETFEPDLFITEDDQLIVNEDGSGDGFQTEDS